MTPMLADMYASRPPVHGEQIQLSYGRQASVNGDYTKISPDRPYFSHKPSGDKLDTEAGLKGLRKSEDKHKSNSPLIHSVFDECEKFIIELIFRSRNQCMRFAGIRF
jgi:hypothetical protein